MSHVTNCPRCHGDLSSASFTERGLICPHCQNPLAGADIAGLSVPQMDTDVTRSVRAATVVLGVLIVLNAGTIAAAFFGTRGPVDLLCGYPLLFGLLDVLVLCLVLPPLMREYARWPDGRTTGKSVAHGCGAFVLAGCVIVAVVVVFFTACWGLLTLKG